MLLICFHPIFFRTLYHTPSLAHSLHLPSHRHPGIAPYGRNIARMARRIRQLMAVIALLAVRLIHRILIGVGSIHIQSHLPSHWNTERNRSIYALDFHSSEIHHLPYIGSRESHNLIRHLIIIGVKSGLQTDSTSRIPQRFPSKLMRPSYTEVPFRSILRFEICVADVQIIHIRESRHAIGALHHRPEIERFIGKQTIVHGDAWRNPLSVGRNPGIY